MNMNKQELYEVAEQMVEMLGTEHMLDELLRAMDSKELQENLEFIDRTNDTNLFD